MPCAVVFAYHDVGVRCLQVLLAGGIDVRLVVTHADDPNEKIWFGSVAKTAADYGIPVIVHDGPGEAGLVAQIASLAPDFLFSFYYRRMLGRQLLVIPARGAFNMHGSLLPKYRGRVPVNWAIIHGERETGATLHEMVEKPDAGRIVDQQAVPILPDDLAIDVFHKVTVAAEMVLARSLPLLIQGSAQLRTQDLSRGSYFGGRKPEDGRIDWSSSAQAIHNLVRAVAPPFPGAFTEVQGARLRLLRARLAPGEARASAPALMVEAGECHAVCGDGATLRLLGLELDGKPFTAADFLARYGAHPIALPTP